MLQKNINFPLCQLELSEKFILKHCNVIAMPNKKSQTPAESPFSITMNGFEVVEKVAKPCATSARILVPKHWIGKRVRAVRVDP